MVKHNVEHVKIITHKLYASSYIMIIIRQLYSSSYPKGPNGYRGLNSLLKISTTTLSKDVRQLNGEASVALAY